MSASLPPWTVEQADRQNRAAEAVLRGSRKQAKLLRHDKPAVPRSILVPGGALFRLAYADCPRGDDVLEVWWWDRQPLPDHRGALKSLAEWASLSADSARGAAREILAALVLSYEPHEGAPWYPAALESGAYNRLGPGTIEYSPSMQSRESRFVRAACDVLCEAMPWIRSCKVCRRYFVLRRSPKGATETKAALCGERCKRVHFARKHRVESKKGPRKPRGPKPTDYAEQNLRLHNEWLDALRAVRAGTAPDQPPALARPEAAGRSPRVTPRGKSRKPPRRGELASSARRRATAARSRKSRAPR